MYRDIKSTMYNISSVKHKVVLIVVRSGRMAAGMTQILIL